jgi:hypothetical protein
MRKVFLAAKPNAKSRIDWTGVPAGFRGQVSAVVRTLRDAEQLEAFYGSPYWVPARPVLLLLPGNPTIVGYEGGMTARQLREQCMAVLWSLVERARQDTQGLVLRERGGPVDPELLRGRVMKSHLRQQLGGLE